LFSEAFHFKQTCPSLTNCVMSSNIFLLDETVRAGTTQHI